MCLSRRINTTNRKRRKEDKWEGREGGERSRESRGMRYHEIHNPKVTVISENREMLLENITTGIELY